MVEQYRKANDRIHVPEELMQRTKEAVRQEEKKQKVRTIQRYIVLAACFCLVCLGVWRFTGRDRIIVQEVEIDRTEMSIGLNLGKHEVEADGDKGVFQADVCETREEVPEELWELEPSRISGQEIYIGKTADGVWHAAFENDGEVWYATGEGMQEDEFTDRLKDIL